MESTPTSGTQTPASTMSSTTDETSTSSVSEIEAPTTTSTSRNLDFSTLQDLFPLAPSSGEQQLQHDPSSLWYILTTAVLLSFHREKLTGALWEYLATTNADSPQNEKELLEIARRIRESCLKASTLVGFPRAINALFSLQTSITTTHPSLSSILATDTSLRAPLDPTAKYDRGMSFFQQIYTKHTTRVLSAMDSTSGGDLTHFAINCIYGELLSEHTIIGAQETGLLEFVCCLADGCGPQAKG
ncbi:hypothetical protein LTR47_006905 [Exophiala xenobiotica]|nr:hypothetical protein LTR47_006905 [Exophiala xenobiotica]KAK5249292.1 hypothetical protein LTS06_005801 [Exophiala xenobiotica]KAK5353176.1 hypothetical protein LTR61_003133 [Exophiala xenobiotica]KAK5379957.1 hypothetical protein LTR11_003585 [Exophiala xenobiotica]KAK5387043.1 hypothetical protein LTS03_002317 [Exophiala xenobiotica]